MQSSREVVLPPFRFWETRWGTSGSPVILIHGLGGSSDWWRRNTAELAREHIVATIDLIGFGRNRLFMRPSRLPLGFADVASLLGRWIDDRFDGPVHLVGNSMGGHIAIHLAALRPDLARSLVLVDSTGIPFELKPRPHIENLVIPRGAFSFAHILARDAFRSGPTSLAVALARIMRDDARPLMHELSLPVLLVWGEHDPLVPLTYASEMQQAIPGSRLVVIPRAGHIPMWENAAAFNREVTSFLRGVDQSDGLSAATTPASFAWPLSGWTDGIAHRSAGARRDVVLVHGLGMSSRYLEPLARELFAHGWSPVAPDLPGFGESANAPGMSPEDHARRLAGWCDALEIREAVWVGHSLGCNVAAHVAKVRPDLVRALVCIGPLWSRRRHVLPHLVGALLADALREPPSLYARVIPAYWRTGIARWWKTLVRSISDIRAGVPPRAILIAGEDDRLPDHTLNLRRVPGAHACFYSHPAEVASAIDELVRR